MGQKQTLTVVFIDQPLDFEPEVKIVLKNATVGIKTTRKVQIKLLIVTFPKLCHTFVFSYLEYSTALLLQAAPTLHLCCLRRNK